MSGLNKLPRITASFWIMKICATTLGETAGDFLSMTLHVGYALSSVILLSLCMLAVVTQALSKRYIPVLYWTAILSTSTAGTTISDFMDRTLALGYATGTAILLTWLGTTLVLWYWSEKSLAVDKINSLKGESFYWAAILASNTLGTALGDFLADSSGLGFAGGALLISSLLGLVVLAKWMGKFSPILLFWLAFVLTRPFGATFGDLLTKPIEKGGLDLGTAGASLVLAGILLVLIFRDYSKKHSPDATIS